MNAQTQYKISEIMAALKLNEASVRKLLVDTGAPIAELDQNTQEAVTREDVIALAFDRADTREGRLLSKLLNTYTVR
jgi:hypothetical protein